MAHLREPLLVGDRVVVRLAHGDDAAAIVRYYRENDAHLARYESPRPRPFLTVRYWQGEVERRREAFRHDRSCRLFAFDRDGRLTGAPENVLGSIGISNVVRGAFHAAYLGYSIAGAHEGKGLMTEALRLALAFAFGPMNLHRIMANHHPENLRSARVLQRLGFVKEGYAERYLFINGAWRDHVLNALENPAWRIPAGFYRRDEAGHVVEIRPTDGVG